MAKTNEIKIMRIIARLNIGGPARHTIILTRKLNHGLFHSLLVSGQVAPGEGDMGYLAAAAGVTPLIIPQLGQQLSFKQDFIALWKLIRLIIKEKPQIIHTHTAKAGTLGRTAGIIARLIFTLTGKQTTRPRLVHTFHGHVFSGYFGSLKTWVFLAIERFLGRFTDRIIVLSPQQRRELQGKYHLATREKFQIVSLGLDLDPFLASAKAQGVWRQQLGLPKKKMLVGIIGRLTPIKNQQLFLEAITHLKGENISFVVIGDGELKTSLAESADRLGVRDIVSFYGWVKDMPAVYAALDLVVLSSNNEGTPVVVLEALAAGKPVVTTNVGGVSDLLGKVQRQQDNLLIAEHGILVPAGNAAALAQGMSYLLNRKDLREEMGNKGRNFVRGKYTQQQLVQEMEQLYLNLFQEVSEQ